MATSLHALKQLRTVEDDLDPKEKRRRRKAKGEEERDVPLAVALQHLADSKQTAL